MSTSRSGVIERRPTGHPTGKAGKGGNGQARIVAVGGGKGGIGKSVVSVTLAIELVNRGLAVALVDGDLGGPNLHSLLAMQFPRTTLSDFILRRSDTLDELASDTPVPGLRLISGARNALSVANPMYQQKLRLMRAIAALPADVVVVDLGAGTQPLVVDLFLLAHQGIIVVAPEPTAVENAYRFLKAAFLGVLRDAGLGKDAKELLMQAAKERDGRAVSPAELVDAVLRQDAALGERLREQLTGFRPSLLVNQARDASDMSLGDGMCAAASRLFGVEVANLGHLHYCQQTERAIRARLPLVFEHLGRQLVGDVSAVVSRLLAVPLPEPTA